MGGEGAPFGSRHSPDCVRPGARRKSAKVTKTHRRLAGNFISTTPGGSCSPGGSRVLSVHPASRVFHRRSKPGMSPVRSAITAIPRAATTTNARSHTLEKLTRCLELLCVVVVVVVVIVVVVVVSCSTILGSARPAGPQHHHSSLCHGASGCGGLGHAPPPLCAR